MTTLELEKITAKQYTAEQVQTALTTLAINGGNVVKTAQGLGLPATTLYTWRDRDYPNRYKHAVETVAPQIEEAVINQTRAAIVLAADVEYKLLTRLHEEADQLERKDLPGAVRNVSTSKAINVDKLLSLTGRPTQITEHRNADQILQRLNRIGVVIDGTAHEIEGEAPAAGRVSA